MLGLRTTPFAAALLFGIASCNSPEEEYSKPTAEAGVGQVLDLGQTVTLDGSGSEVCCEKTLAYQWYFKQVPLESSIDDGIFGTNNGSPEAQTLQWVPDVPGSYVLGLIVSDDLVASSEDIIVIDIAKNNEIPLSDAGADQAGLVGQIVTFDGSLSTDEKGVQLEYEWILASTPDDSEMSSADLFDANNVSASLVADVPGSFVVGLRVFDKTDWSTPDYATARIASDNTIPVANAGESRAIPPCESASFSLNGLGSYDPEGAVLEYDWTLMTVPEGSTATEDNFDDANSPTPSFAPDVFTGDYGFRLQVSDGESWSAYDEVSFTVSDLALNQAPVASITTDLTVSITAACPLVSGTRKCKPCIPQLDMDATDSYDLDGHEMIYTWTSDEGSFTYFDQDTTQFTGDEFAASYGSSKKHTYGLSVNVSDCADSDTETINIEVTCTGVVP